MGQLTERLPQVRVDEETMNKLQVKVDAGIGNLSDHVRLAVEMYVTDAPPEMELRDETLMVLQWAGAELSSVHGKPLMSLDAMVRALIAHWDATKMGQGEKLNSLGRLPSGVVQLSYS